MATHLRRSPFYSFQIAASRRGRSTGSVNSYTTKFNVPPLSRASTCQIRPMFSFCGQSWDICTSPDVSSCNRAQWVGAPAGKAPAAVGNSALFSFEWTINCQCSLLVAETCPNVSCAWVLRLRPGCLFERSAARAFDPTMGILTTPALSRLVDRIRSHKGYLAGKGSIVDIERMRMHHGRFLR